MAASGGYNGKFDCGYYGIVGSYSPAVVLAADFADLEEAANAVGVVGPEDDLAEVIANDCRFGNCLGDYGSWTAAHDSDFYQDCCSHAGKVAGIKMVDIAAGVVGSFDENHFDGLDSHSVLHLWVSLR